MGACACVCAYFIVLDISQNNYIHNTCIIRKYSYQSSNNLPAIIITKKVTVNILYFNILFSLNKMSYGLSRLFHKNLLRSFYLFFKIHLIGGELLSNIVFFAIYRHESPIFVHVSPILNPPSTSSPCHPSLLSQDWL